MSKAIARLRRVWAVPVAVALLSVVVAQPVAASEFPVGDEGYHTYAEVDARLDAAVTEHGQGTGAIIRRLVIGQSFEGRDIWAVKISDNVATDESEPEVLSECGMHAREHLTVEMCLYMIELLTDSYGEPTALGNRVTNIVNSREVWIVPSLNPDGAAWDIASGSFRSWRKNRQLNPGSDYVGIDLNRNWSYMWACCDGGGNNPKSQLYRGRYPFEAVENQVLRDFVLSRRVDGLQQIRTVFNWHTYGEFVMWPYGYTEEDVPRTMTVDDHAALVAMGRHMATLSGYGAKQGSDSYIYDGDFPAWAYGDQRMFVYTFEMYPPWGCKGCGGFYPPDELIEQETTRNREAVLYLLEQSDCPYREAGLEATRCGPFDDDFETVRGWTISGSGPGTGRWQRGVPQASVSDTGTKQRVRVPSGQAALVTGLASGSSPTADDVDGRTTALSRRVGLGDGRWTLGFKFAFAHDDASTSADYLRVSVVSGGVTTPVWTIRGQGSDRDASWLGRKRSLDAWAGRPVKLLIEAVDGDADNLVEAAIDDVRIFRTR